MTKLDDVMMRLYTGDAGVRVLSERFTLTVALTHYQLLSAAEVCTARCPMRVSGLLRISCTTLGMRRGA